jgi:hypothetical protein
MLTYRPIPGHGKVNAATMAEAGVVTLVRRDELGDALVELHLALVEPLLINELFLA